MEDSGSSTRQAQPGASGRGAALPTPPTVLAPPYFVHSDGLPGIDFSRDLCPPGTHEAFPDGAVGIRVDDDFWTVAALPWSYVDKPLSEIVAEFWPHYADEAKLCPDHGSREQRLYQLEGRARDAERMRDHLDKELGQARDELKRLRSVRPPLSDRIVTRSEAEASYFIRQYEHLLVAMAHACDPRQDMRGVCAVCGLLGTDRVHQRHWIDKRAAGYEPRDRPLPFFPEDDDGGAKQSPLAPSSETQRLTTKTPPKLGWAMVNEVFDEIFPGKRGNGPYSGLGRTMPPSEWKFTIKRGLERAFEKLLEEPAPKDTPND